MHLSASNGNHKTHWPEGSGDERVKLIDFHLHDRYSIITETYMTQA